jgi:hypothetical protein
MLTLSPPLKTNPRPGCHEKRDAFWAELADFLDAAEIPGKGTFAHLSLHRNALAEIAREFNTFGTGWEQLCKSVKMSTRSERFYYV